MLLVRLRGSEEVERNERKKTDCEGGLTCRSSNASRSLSACRSDHGGSNQHINTFLQRECCTRHATIRLRRRPWSKEESDTRPMNMCRYGRVKNLSTCAGLWKGEGVGSVADCGAGVDKSVMMMLLMVLCCACVPVQPHHEAHLRNVLLPRQAPSYAFCRPPPSSSSNL